MPDTDNKRATCPPMPTCDNCGAKKSCCRERPGDEGPWMFLCAMCRSFLNRTGRLLPVEKPEAQA